MTFQHISTNKRVLFFDQIRALMIALVIAIHVVPLAFTSGWIGVRVPTTGSSDAFFGVAGSFFAYFCNTFFMCMLFLISGYFVPRSAHKKGIARYLKDRLLRIGVPFLVGLLLINNASVLLGRLSPSSPLAELSWNTLPFNSIMALWFLVVLFVFDLLYCTWVSLRGNRFSVDAAVPTPQLHSWIISAFVLGILEVVMLGQKDLWVALVRSPLNGLGAQGMHIFTYAFLFFLVFYASFH